MVKLAEGVKNIKYFFYGVSCLYILTAIIMIWGLQDVLSKKNRRKEEARLEIDRQFEKARTSVVTDSQRNDSLVLTPLLSRLSKC